MYNFYPKKLVQPSGYAPNILLTMKLTAVILTTAILQVSANTFGQKVTLVERNAPLQQVFEKISEQTGYDFLISTETLKESSPVSINVKREDLRSVLGKIFAKQPLQYEIQERIVVVSRQSTSTQVMGQLSIKPVTVSGKVVDSLGRPLGGATLSNQANKVVAITGTNGTFSFEASNGDQIMVSYIGFNSLSFAVEENNLNRTVILYPVSSKLQEISVVSTGYQTIPKERITGSFEQINNEGLNRRVGTDIISRLDGNSSILFDKRVPGSPTLQIRGLSTLTQGIA